MSLRRALTLPLLAVFLFAAASGTAWTEEEKKVEKPAEKMAEKPALDAKSLDNQIHATLRNVINQGADIYNSGDFLGCYRLYEGALTAYRPVLAHRPNLQKAIDDGLVQARTTARGEDKAFILRSVIDQIRKEINPNPTPVTPVAKTLWDRLGAEKGVGKVVDDFVAAAAADPKVDFTRGGKFKLDAKGAADLKKKLVEMVSSVSGGPLKYTGKSMKEVHKGMWITDEEFDAASGHLAAALKKNGVKDEDAKAVLDVVGGTRKDIVEGKKPEAPKPTTLWDKLGGEKVVSKVVDDFFATASKDPKVNLDRNGTMKREGEALAQAKKMLVAWISSQTGGKIPYAGKSMKDAHKGLGITDEEFDATGKHLEDALRKNTVKEEDAKALLDIFKKFKADVVQPKKPEPKPEPTTKALWDRLGGEAGVGKVVDDFVATVAADPKVNFFRDPKYKPTKEQVATIKKQLVELISSVSGGPLPYTGKKMKEAHKGMMITDAEFDAAAKHLETALKNNKVADEDVKKVMEVIGTTRKDIVEKKP